MLSQSLFKPTNTKKLFIFVLILMLGSLLLGCGSGAATPASSPDATVPKAVDLSGQKITLLMITPHVVADKALAEWFNAETGAVVQLAEVGYPDLLDQTLADISASSPQYDVVEIWYPTLGTLVEAGALTDLTEFIKANETVIQPDDFIDNLYDPYTLYKGKRWAIPFDGDTHVLFYRKSLLEKHNLTPPETWDDYLHVAKTITEQEGSSGVYGSAIMGNAAPILIVSSFLNRLGGYGGQLLDSNGQPAVNSPEAVAALAAMLEESAYALPTPLDTDFDVARDAFLTGKVAMVEQWTDIGVMAEDVNQSTIQGDWGVVQMPMGSGGKAQHAPALNAGFSLGLSSKAKNVEAAQEFLRFAARPDITIRVSTITGGLDPTRISVVNSKEYKEFAPEVSAAAQAALTGATAWPTSPEMPQLMDALIANLVAALEGKKSPQQALDETQARWEEILGSK
ncbi:MAG: sugar ABC transporter substrate-binding protein [Chloroflexota bacterium]